VMHRGKIGGPNKKLMLHAIKQTNDSGQFKFD
jgi:hypothetical protein